MCRAGPLRWNPMDPWHWTLTVRLVGKAKSSHEETFDQVD